MTVLPGGAAGSGWLASQDDDEGDHGHEGGGDQPASCQRAGAGETGRAAQARKAGGRPQVTGPAAGHGRGWAGVQDPVSASSATAVRGSSIDSTAQSANAPIAYGAAWTSAAPKL